MLTLKEKIFYPFGQISISLLNQVLVLWILFFYAPPEGKILVPVELAGLAVTVGRIVDAITDPLVAYVSDKFRSRFGRRIPFIAFGAPFLFLVFFLLWTPPVKEQSVWNLVYLIIFSSLFWTFNTICAIPYWALLPEIATTTRERIDLSTFVALAMVIGMSIAFGGSYFLSKNFKLMGFVFGFISFLCFYAVVFTTKERTEVTSEYSKFNIFSAIITTFKNKPFLIYLYCRFCFEFGWNLLAAGATYLVTVLLGLKKEMVGPIMGIVMIAGIVSFPFFNFFSKTLGKKKMFSLVMLIIAISLSLVFFAGKIPLPISLTYQAYILMFLIGFPFGGFLILPNAILADIIDYDEKITGMRREGMYGAVQGFIIKFGISFAAFVAGILFKYFGYTAEKDLGIRLLGPVAALFIFIAFIVFQFYNLEEKND